MSNVRPHVNQPVPAEELLQKLEESLLEPSVRKSERVQELLADQFVEFGSSGQVFNQSQVMAMLHAESSVAADASEFRVQFPSPEVALVTYRACRAGEPSIHTLRSSVWKQAQGRWQRVFHQRTLAQPPR